MGSKYSQNIRGEKSPEKTILFKFNVEPDDTSISQKTNEYTDKSSITTTTEVIDNELKRVPFTFEWKGEGDLIELTGDFNNWEWKYRMEKNYKTGYYEKILYLEKKRYNFKFIVDNLWRCSNQYPTAYDEHGNLNNFISLYNYSPPKELLKHNVKEIKTENKNEINNKTNEINNINKEEKDEINKNQEIERKEDPKKKQYNCKYPLINELNIIAPVIMWHYKPLFNLDYPSNQDNLNQRQNSRIKKKTESSGKNLEYKEKNFNNENNTYKKIITCPHEKLMHFCMNLDVNNDFFKLCTTIRTKHKFLTLIYYKPK